MIIQSSVVVRGVDLNYLYTTYFNPPMFVHGIRVFSLRRNAHVDPSVKLERALWLATEGYEFAKESAQRSMP